MSVASDSVLGLAGKVNEHTCASIASVWRGGDAYVVKYLAEISHRSEHVWEIASKYLTCHSPPSRQAEATDAQICSFMFLASPGAPKTPRGVASGDHLRSWYSHLPLTLRDRDASQPRPNPRRIGHGAALRGRRCRRCRPRAARRSCRWRQLVDGRRRGLALLPGSLNTRRALPHVVGWLHVTHALCSSMPRATIFNAFRRSGFDVLTIAVRSDAALRQPRAQ